MRCGPETVPERCLLIQRVSTPQPRCLSRGFDKPYEYTAPAAHSQHGAMETPLDQDHGRSPNTPVVPGLVSIVMPAYNAVEFLAESVRSAQQQTYRNWELLLIDDASSDGTLQLAHEFARDEPRIRVAALPENGGVANARNAGIAMARGQYLAFLDSDDLWLPNKLEAQLSFMRASNVGFCFSSYRRFNLETSRSTFVLAPRRIGYPQLLTGNPIGCLTVVLDRTKLPPFAMPPVPHEDYVTWLGLLKQGHFAYGIQEELARYRITPHSLSGKKMKSAGWTWNIYRNVEHFNLIKSLWYFGRHMSRAVWIRLFR